MAHRNFSMIAYLDRREKDWRPLFSFRGQTVEEWQAWPLAERSDQHAGPVQSDIRW